MDFIINNQVYSLVDSLEGISAKDSFTHRDNKLGVGNGAREWHVGSKQDLKRFSFFGGHNFNIRCCLKKSDLLWLLDEMKLEYQNPSQNYRQRDIFREIWQQRFNIINELPNEELFFNLKEHDSRKSTDARLYAKNTLPDSYGTEYYELIRKLMLPNITSVSILKLMSDRFEIVYYFKIFPEFSSETFKDVIENTEIEKIRDIRTIPETEKLQLVKSRIGQGIFRDRLILDCPICPITLVTDSRFLIASHIKPWRVSSNSERLDVNNGLLFTPTFDKLFDGGYISFNNKKELLISPFVDNQLRRCFNITEGETYPRLSLNGRVDYMDYHRMEIFKK